MQLLMESPLLAKMLIFGLGAAVRVIAPLELKAAVLQEAQALVQRWAEPPY